MAASTERLLLVSALSACLLFVLAPAEEVVAQDTTPPASPDALEMFQARCASCHGDDATGTDLGPSLEDVGAASADFQLRTGRMPLNDPGAPTVRKPPAFDEDEIEALVAYVASLGDGPDIPMVAPELGHVSDGQVLFIDNCAPCHGATGNGGAVGPDALAPSLYAATDVQVAEATIVGPGEMPKFTFDQQELNDIVRFMDELRTERPAGGADIGGIGPVPEGLVAWGVGVLAVVAICFLIGTRRRDEKEADAA
jgi:ubiquinol-cytochrome c reductase cytochrome c subunit